MQGNLYKEYQQIRNFRTLSRRWRRKLVIDQASYRKQCYATGIVRIMANFLRLRYVLLGAVGAGAVGCKMVSVYTTLKSIKKVKVSKDVETSK